MAEDGKAIGAGSGGGPDHTHSVEGLYTIAANQIALVSQPPIPPAVPGPTVVTILADTMGEGGRVEVRGSQGVRVTAGPPPEPTTTSEATNGVEIAVGEAQFVTISRGLIPDVDQTITMMPGAGITINGGACPVTVQSMTEITLSVLDGMSTVSVTPEGITLAAAGGANTISLTPEGISITGLMITITGALVQIN